MLASVNGADEGRARRRWRMVERALRRVMVGCSGFRGVGSDMAASVPGEESCDVDDARAICRQL